MADFQSIEAYAGSFPGLNSKTAVKALLPVSFRTDTLLADQLLIWQTDGSPLQT